MADWQDPKTMSLWVWGVCLMILFLIVYFLLFVKNYVNRLILENQEKANLKLKAQQDLLRNTLDIQEEERGRIAMDLHDNLISQLNIIHLLNQNKEDRKSINEKLKESMKVARQISHDLAPPFLEEMSLDELLRNYVVSVKSGTQTGYYSTLVNDEVDLINGKIHFFRIFQELITNCLRHADATKIDVHFRCSNKIISLIVRDNGKGFEKDRDRGLGLQNIESRAQFLEAKYKFKTKERKGTRFILALTLINNGKI